MSKDKLRNEQTDASYVFLPIPMTFSIPMTWIGVDWGAGYSETKKTVVEKLDKNLADGWEPKVVVNAGRINEITDGDVYTYGTDELCRAFGFTKEEHTKEPIEIDLRQLVSDATIQEISKEVGKQFKKTISELDPSLYKTIKITT